MGNGVWGKIKALMVVDGGGSGWGLTFLHGLKFGSTDFTPICYRVECILSNVSSHMLSFYSNNNNNYYIYILEIKIDKCIIYKYRLIKLENNIIQ